MKSGIIFGFFIIISVCSILIPVGKKDKILVSSGADYAEWFEKESGSVMPGDIVGLNVRTGRARKYVEGDALLGICSGKPGFVGDKPDNKTDDEMEMGHILVALMGKLRVNKDMVNLSDREVRTKDGVFVGYILSDGRVFIKMK
ncbi:MAG: hypothetical protein LHV68_13120 [Elusimicrobia bacterium]|nr:hypothetical protein [Candidatus Liberimonas magnetica]